MKNSIIAASLALVFSFVGITISANADAGVKGTHSTVATAQHSDNTPPELRGEEYRAPIKMKTYEKAPVKSTNSRYK